MSRGVAAFGIVAAVAAGLIAASAGGGGGDSLITIGDPAGQQQAGQAAPGAAAAGACVPGDGGLPAPGEPRKDSLTRPARPIPADRQAMYQQAGQTYGLPWELLAGVGMIETNHAGNNAVSSAGAQGPMQFMPGTWQGYGVDGDGDGRKDVTNAADAIPAAANYLRASGAPGDVRKALFAYNRADWYVNDVLWYAQQYGAKGCTPAGGQAVAGGAVAGAADANLAAPPSKFTAVEAGLEAPAAAGLRAAAAKWPQIKTWGGRAGRKTKSDHPRGYAIDGMIPQWNTTAGNKFGWQVARWFESNAKALKVKYVIYDDQIWKPAVGWGPYTHKLDPGRKDANLRHLNHVPVSFLG